MLGGGPNFSICFHTVQYEPNTELMTTFQVTQLGETQRRVKEANTHSTGTSGVPQLQDRGKCLVTASSVSVILISIMSHKWQNQYREMKMEYKEA